MGLHEGRTVTLEVTRFTNRALLRDWRAAEQHAERTTLLTAARSWHVTFEGHPRYTDLGQRPDTAFHTLEVHGLEHFYEPFMGWWMIHVPTLKQCVRVLHDEGVVDARVVDLDDPGAPSQLLTSASGSWTYGGPDTALDELDRYLADERKHLAKISGAGSDERHLFVWTDAATPAAFGRALTPDYRWAAEPERKMLPSRPPACSELLEHLWVVNEGQRRGWHWELSHGWHWVEEPQSADS